MLKYLIVSMRPKHWIKNFFVFIPLLVSGSFFNWALVKNSLFAFLSFCLVSSIVYIFNDILDKEKDKKHQNKKYRPIAIGKISFSTVLFFIFFLSSLIFLFQSISKNNIYVSIISYLGLNISYSLWLKRIPIIDVLCISIGFVIRVQAGVFATGLETSKWLISMTFTMAMFLALGKRKVELKNSDSHLTRESLAGYTILAIENMQNIFIACTLILYLLYTELNKTFSGNKEFLYISSVFVITGLLRYVQLSYDDRLEDEPTNILYKDRFILISVFFWGLIISLSYILEPFI